MSIFGRIVDYILLAAITIMFSIPVVTAGAAFTSMYYVAMKMARDEEPYVWKDYIKSFKQNFRQATVLWIITAAVIGIIIADIYFNRTMFPDNTVLPVIVWAVSIIFALFAVYFFPVLARFDLPVKHIIKNSMLLSIGNLFKSILVVAVTAAPFVAVYYLLEYAAWIVIIGFPAVICANSYIFTSVFRWIEPEKEDTDTEDTVETEDETISK